MDAGALVAVPASVPPPLTLSAPSLPLPVAVPVPAACSPPTPLSPVPLPIASTTSSMIPLKLDAPKPVYSSPPPASSSPENNTCRMIEYRGAKVAAFNVDGRELICLPQAFELFLKHLVGGLHTVYTKLKRLDITPIVCNVEQVRILRGLGAIQPGVNRCKLISPKEFDVLYEDCTNSSARPGRPPKRSPSMTATPETLEKLKKSRMDNGDYPGYHHPRLLVPPPSMFADPKKSPLFSNGYHYPPHLAASLPFMHLGHPMMSMAMAGHLGMRPDGSIIRERPTQENDLSSPRTRDDRYDDGLARYEDNNNKPLDKPLNLEIDKQRDRRPSNTDKESGMSTPSEYMANGQLDLSTKPHHVMHSGNEDMTGDDDSDEDKDDDELSNSDIQQQTTQNGETSTDKPNLGNYSHLLNTENSGISSIETLLLNIQGLLKVASENARHRERQMNYEKAELKMELMRERELRESLEKQLMEEHRNRAGLVKRLKKEKRARRKLQDQMERVGVNTVSTEDVMERTSPDNLRMLSDSLSSHTEQSNDRDCPLSSDPDRRLPDARSGLQNLMDTFLGQQQKTCSSSANGYIHSPVIKQTESV